MPKQFKYSRLGMAMSQSSLVVLGRGARTIFLKCAFPLCSFSGRALVFPRSVMEPLPGSHPFFVTCQWHCDVVEKAPATLDTRGSFWTIITT